MFLVTIPLIVSAAYSGLPKNRLAAIIGPESAKIARLERLQTSDSLNDGSTAAGILTGPDRHAFIYASTIDAFIQPKRAFDDEDQCQDFIH